MSAGSMRLNHNTSAAWLRFLLRSQPTCRPALQVRGVSAVQPGTSAPNEAAARDPHAPPLFSRSRTGLFFQAQPQLKNPFLEDPLLGRYLRRHLPPQVRIRRVGEDVAEAEPQPDGSYRLHGFKWFTSATDADMTLPLGRVVGRDGSTPPGSRGVSLFYAEVRRDPQGRLEGIEVQRLKDKLGTRQMPTAELLLDGLPAHRTRACRWRCG
ncbi:uncharacterized protein LOC115553565 [Gadus morhua]|uniref:uncharacterized protein LOC115553565 n=1 Tax=Gadus morhua TaxID=8049 RepID=UPI0011B43A47|nr:uncharacterized protein LOC115553565 [Gadus morhua]